MPETIEPLLPQGLSRARVTLSSRAGPTRRCLSRPRFRHRSWTNRSRMLRRPKHGSTRIGAGDRSHGDRAGRIRLPAPRAAHGTFRVELRCHTGRGAHRRDCRTQRPRATRGLCWVPDGQINWLPVGTPRTHDDRSRRIPRNCARHTNSHPRPGRRHRSPDPDPAGATHRSGRPRPPVKVPTNP